MLCYIFLALSALASVLITALSGIYWLWAFPIFLGIFIVINPLYFCILWVSTVFMPKKDPIDKPLKGIYFMIQFSTEWLVTLLRIKVRFNGMDKLPDEPFVLVSNHLSNFDPIVVLSKIKKRKIAFISKASNFKIPVAGVYVHNAGFLAIDRENAMNALRTLKRAGEMMNREQMIMGIYPEGTRSKSGELLEFKEGAFLLARRANAPIVVMSTHGTNLISKRSPWRRTVVDLNVLDVIDRETVKATPLADMSDRVRATIAADLETGR